MVALLSISERGATHTMKDVQHVLQEELNQQWALCTLTHHLSIKYSHQKAMFKDPCKWCPDNCCLIADFVTWRLEIPINTHYQVKIFNKACVDHTNLRNLVVWSQQGKQPVCKQYWCDIIVKSWMVTVLMVLDHPYPLHYTITADLSNRDKFLDFAPPPFTLMM
jgi:hypothetical protein